MTWYRVTTGEQGTHRGTITRGRLLTECGGAFQASLTVCLDGDVPDPDQVSPECLRKVRAR